MASPAVDKLNRSDLPKPKKTVQQMWQECQKLSEELQVAMTSSEVLSAESLSIVDFRKRKRLVDWLEEILLEDLAYGLSKGAEQSLWNACYKAFIDFFQARLRQRKSDVATEAALLSEFLSAAAGSLSQLLTEICINYRLNVPGFRGGAWLGILTNHWLPDARSTNQQRKKVAEKDGLSFVQFCLVHLGDIYRYQRHLPAAESSYLHAAMVAPSSGHPWNQLGILETARGDHISATYFYTRALYVEDGFLPAAGNLEKFYSYLNGLTSTDDDNNYGQAFLKFHARLHHCVDLESVGNQFFPVLNRMELVLNASELDSHHALHLFVINLGALWRITSNFSENFADGASVAEFRTYQLVCELIQTQISGFLSFCISKLGEKSEETEWKILETFLPVLNPVLQTVCCVPNVHCRAVLDAKTHRTEIYKNMTDFLKVLEEIRVKKVKPWDCQRLKTLAKWAESDEVCGQDVVWNQFWKEDAPAEGLKTMPLPENLDLKGFLPIEKGAHKALNFQDWPMDLVRERFVQDRRILMLIGRIKQFLADSCKQNSLEQLNANSNSEDDNLDLNRLTDWDYVKERIALAPGRDLEPDLGPETTIGTGSIENSARKSAQTDARSETEKCDSPSSVRKSKTKVLPLIRILERKSSEGLAGGVLPPSEGGAKENLWEGPVDSNLPERVSGELGERLEEKKGILKVKKEERSVQPAARPKQQPMPPRFQAAKLKQALTGIAVESAPAPAPALGAAPPEAWPRQQEANLAGFPALPLGMTPAPPTGRRSAEPFRPPSPLGGTTPDPTELARAPTFPRTPGTRFHAPPPFMGMPRFPGPPPPIMYPPRPMPRGMPHLRSGPPPRMVPAPGFGAPPMARMMVPLRELLGSTNLSQPADGSGRQFWTPSPPHAQMQPPPRGPPPWENNVFFSKPNDPYFQLWQSGIDTMAGNHSELLQKPTNNSSTSSEIWGSGSHKSMTASTGIRTPTVFEASRMGIGIEHFPFTGPPPTAPRVRPPNEFLMNRDPGVPGGFSLFGGGQEPSPYPKWSENDGKE